MNDSGWEETVEKPKYESRTDHTIYLRNLPGSLTESRIRARCSKFGQIDFTDFPTDATGNNQGYAYIKFGGPRPIDACEEAVRILNGSTVDGMKIEAGIY